MLPKRLYKILAIAEAVTWTLLIAGMLAKYVFSVGDWPVSVSGPIHGFVFLAYGAMAVIVSINQRWPFRVAALSVGSAVIPYATIPVHAWLARTRRLEGDWRVEASDDPRDARWHDRLTRAFLRRPWLFFGVVTVAIVVVFVVLLIVGPPGGEA